ncbi:MAG: NrsF family protein [Pseudomonadota bacterium]
MDKLELIEKLSEEGAAKPLPHPFKQSLIWIVGIIVFMGAVISIEGFRFDINEKIQSLPFILEIILLLATGISALTISIYDSRPAGLPSNKLRAIPFILIVIWFYAAYSESMYMLNMENFIQSVKSDGYMCTCHILLVTVLPLFILFYFIRMGASVHQGWTGGMATLGVCSFTYLFMRFVEANDDIVHLLVWHALPIVIFCLISIKVSKKFLHW